MILIRRFIGNTTKTDGSLCKVPDTVVPLLTKFEFSRQIFEKMSPLSNFTKICPVGDRADTYGRTDRQTNVQGEANRHFPLLCTRAKNENIIYV
jgi:hypothetical protein